MLGSWTACPGPGLWCLLHESDQCRLPPAAPAVVDGSGHKVAVQFVQHIEGFQHTPLTFHLSMSSLLYLRQAPGGRGWVIAKQVDYHSFESILFHAPWTGWLLRGLRAAVGATIIGGTRLAAGIWPSVEPLMRALPCSDVVGELAARLWWKRGARGGSPGDFGGEGFGGVLEPYDPHK